MATSIRRQLWLVIAAEKAKRTCPATVSNVI